MFLCNEAKGKHISDIQLLIPTEEQQELSLNKLNSKQIFQKEMTFYLVQ